MAIEILFSPYDVFWAPVGESFPAIGASPGGNWLVLGTSVAERTNEDGVMVAFEQEFEEFRAAGTSAPIEASRVRESVIISLTLHDLRPNMLRLVLNNNAITNTAAGAAAGFDEIDLERGPGKPQEMALLVRGDSTQFATGNAQYQIPRCYVSSSPEIVHTKGEAAGIELEFRALRAASSPYMGKLISQDSAPT